MKYVKLIYGTASGLDKGEIQKLWIGMNILDQKIIAKNFRKMMDELAIVRFYMLRYRRSVPK